MKKYLMLLIILFWTHPDWADPIAWPYLPAIDYLRGTTGERLFFSHFSPEKGQRFFNNDLRYYHFNRYLDPNGNEHHFNSHSRFINIFSINWVLSTRTEISTRIPMIRIKNNEEEEYRSSNAGLGDLLFQFKYRVLQSAHHQFALSVATGFKLPANSFLTANEEALPLGTETFDIPLILNTDFYFKTIRCFFDVAYITPVYDLSDLVMWTGDEVFAELVLLKALNQSLAAKIEINYVYVYNYYEMYKTTLTPGIIFTSRSKALKIELGWARDIAGQYVFYGMSPVVRFHYQLSNGRQCD